MRFPRERVLAPSEKGAFERFKPESEEIRFSIYIICMMHAKRLISARSAFYDWKS